jgi:hypothetical protein
MDQLLTILFHPAVTAAVAAVAAVIWTRYSAKQAPGSVAQTIEADAFGLLVKGIQKLADTTAHDAAIVAAQQAKALQLAQLDHARAVLNGLAAGPQQPPQPPSAS